MSLLWQNNSGYVYPNKKLIMKKNESEPILNRQENLSKEFLTLDEAANYLSISRSAMYKKTSKKEIAFYVPGGKQIYFLRNDLDNWILGGKINPVSEFNTETECYLSRTSKNLMS